MIKQIINTFVAIAACLGVAAFVMVLVRKQNCQTKEPFDYNTLPVMKMKVGTSDGQICKGVGDCNPSSFSPPAGVVTRFCKNSNCTGCDGTWDVGVACDTSATDHSEDTGRCIAAKAGADVYVGGGNHYEDGYVCWTRI